MAGLGIGVEAGATTLLEAGFPSLEVSRLLEADRRTRDPVYSAHRWWARRPPALMRAILLAAVFPPGAVDDYWEAYATPTPHLAGLRVYDPFMGGGTTLVEAARMGAAVSGCDVDPVSRDIVVHALSPADGAEILAAGQQMLSDLRGRFAWLYPEGDGEPLHYFWLHEVTCPHCRTVQLLHRSRILARDIGKVGAVVREHPLTVFDPDDAALIHLPRHDRKVIDRGGRRLRLGEGNFHAGRLACGTCGQRSSHAELRTGMAPRRLVAVERTPTGGRRRLMSPSAEDLRAVDHAADLLDDPPVVLTLPDGEFVSDRRDGRPRSYGIERIRDLFTPRQQLVLGTAATWIREEASLNAEVRAGLSLALSNSLTTNNRLCSYAADYGRLSALFSVRGYSLPWLPVELNPLHSSSGRGTLLQCIRRVSRSCEPTTWRHVWRSSTSTVEAQTLALVPQPSSVSLYCASSADADPPTPVDLVVFDPPYFDFIEYDELAELFRAWRPGSKLAGQTLQSAAHDAPGRFGASLAECLKPSLEARPPGRPLAFTYHSSRHEAWEAVGVALDEAKLGVTALWPVRSDGHMGHHSHPGNCEWDVIVVARPIVETVPRPAPASSLDLMSMCGDLEVGAADAINLSLASEMAAARWGDVRPMTNGVEA